MDTRREEYSAKRAQEVLEGITAAARANDLETFKTLLAEQYSVEEQESIPIHYDSDETVSRSYFIKKPYISSADAAALLAIAAASNASLVVRYLLYQYRVGVTQDVIERYFEETKEVALSLDAISMVQNINLDVIELLLDVIQPFVDNNQNMSKSCANLLLENYFKELFSEENHELSSLNTHIEKLFNDIAFLSQETQQSLRTYCKQHVIELAKRRIDAELNRALGFGFFGHDRHVHNIKMLCQSVEFFHGKDSEEYKQFIEVCRSKVFKQGSGELVRELDGFLHISEALRNGSIGSEVNDMPVMDAVKRGFILEHTTSVTQAIDLKKEYDALASTVYHAIKQCAIPTNSAFTNFFNRHQHDVFKKLHDQVVDGILGKGAVAPPKPTIEKIHLLINALVEQYNREPAKNNTPAKKIMLGLLEQFEDKAICTLTLRNNKLTFNYTESYKARERVLDKHYPREATYQPKKN